MDWRQVSFDWNHARAFFVVAEERSFSAAARALRLSQPTVGRQVAALEEELSIALFSRVGNALHLTEAGADLVEHVRAMSDAATRVSLVATGQSLALEGSVCITASELISAYLLPPIVGRLRAEHPSIEIEIVASNAARDLRRREADIAIRNFKPTEAELVARKIDERVAYAYATPAYLAGLGHPRSVADLSHADFLAFDRTERMIGYLEKMGVPLTAKNFPIVSENHLVQWELAKAGVGICFVMSEVGDAEPRVRRVTPDFPAHPRPHVAGGPPRAGDEPPHPGGLRSLGRGPHACSSLDCQAEEEGASLSEEAPSLVDEPGCYGAPPSASAVTRSTPRSRSRRTGESAGATKLWMVGSPGHNPESVGWLTTMATEVRPVTVGPVTGGHRATNAFCAQETRHDWAIPSYETATSPSSASRGAVCATSAEKVVAETVRISALVST
jgi:DNA-binding transcriptional LysR family regulator